jgi:hypothetical protein
MIKGPSSTYNERAEGRKGRRKRGIERRRERQREGEGMEGYGERE